VAQLFQQARRAPIPAPHESPPGVLSYGDLLLTNRLGARIAHHRPVPKEHNNARRDGFQGTIVVIV